MKKFVYGLGAIVAPSLLGAFMVGGCSEDGTDNPLASGSEALCGPCGTIASGDVGISGDARLDGFFKALSTMQNATFTIQADFEANVRALAAVYDVQLTGAIDAAAITQLKTKISADIEANVSGGLKVDYQPPRCQASVKVAVEAQAKCEVKADCQVNVDPGEASVVCQGSCSGSCSGTCSGELACEVDAGNVECEGQCEGSCSLEVAAACSGTCRGDCVGNCSAQGTDGKCAGQCDGTCQGTCELSAGGSCSGTCTGKCRIDAPTAGCSAMATCRGKCAGECTGGCEGNFTPPSASANCDAAADCQASAKAEANASLECTPPQVKIDYEYSVATALNLEAQAAFTARLSELRVRGTAILQGAAKYEALLTGKVNQRNLETGDLESVVVFDPSPRAALEASVRGFANASAFAKFDIGSARIACVVDAVGEAGPILANLASGTATTLTAQASFVTAFTGGFGT